MTSIDPWFLRQVREAVDFEQELAGRVTGNRVARENAAKPSATASPIAVCAAAWKADAAGGARPAQRAGRPRGVQSRGHLRGGIRKLHAVSVFELRIGVRSRHRPIARRS